LMWKGRKGLEGSKDVLMRLKRRRRDDLFISKEGDCWGRELCVLIDVEGKEGVGRQ